MCPFCIATAVWIAAGAVSTGGVSALALTKFGTGKRASANREKSHEIEFVQQYPEQHAEQ